MLQVVQFNFLPLVVTIVATSQANTGMQLKNYTGENPNEIMLDWTKLSFFLQGWFLV